MAGGFSKAHITGNDGIINAAAEYPADFLCHLNAQICAGIQHGEDDAFNGQVPIDLLNLLDGAHQGGNTLKGIIFALNGDEDTVRCTERIDGNESKRGRTVDEDEIKLIFEGRKGIRHDALTVINAGHFNFGTRKADICGKEEKGFDGGFHNGVHWLNRSGDDLINGRGGLLNHNAEAAGAVPLRIGIHEEDAFSRGGDTGGKVDAGCGLADAAFLVRNSDNFDMMLCSVTYDRFPSECAQSFPVPPVEAGILREAPALRRRIRLLTGHTAVPQASGSEWHSYT